MSEITGLIRQKICNIENSARSNKRSLTSRERNDISNLNDAIKHFGEKDQDRVMTSEEVDFIENLFFDVTGKTIDLRKPVQADTKPTQTSADPKGIHESIGTIRDVLADINRQLGSRSENIKQSVKSLKDYANRRLGSMPFTSLGEFLHNVYLAENPDIDQSKRTIALDRLGRVQAAASGANETIPSEGGFLMPKQWSKEILQQSYNEGQLARMCRRQPVTQGDSLSIAGVDETSRATGSRFGGIQSYWLSEADELTDSKPKFRQINLKLKKNACLIYVTNDLLKDAAALDSFIREVGPAEIAFQIDNAILNGTGVGMPLGILNAGSTIVVSKESGQAASTIVSDNVFKMISRTIGPLSNYVWLYNKSCIKQIFGLSMTVGTGGGPLFVSMENKLMGIPLVECEQCSPIGTAGDLILANLRGYIISDGGLDAALSIHVRFIYDETVFRFILSVDGQPVRATALTPANGSDTQSQFVCLETRS